MRKLARERGIDLADVPGTGDRGLITRHDVETLRDGQGRSHVADGCRAEQPGRPGPAGRSGRGRPRARRASRSGACASCTAEAMVRSAFTAPHATVFLTVDVTPTMELLERLRAQREFAEQPSGPPRGRRRRRCASPSRRTPAVNARWDEQAQEIVEFGYVNLGIAAATPRGLVVPTIPDADALDLAGLATSIRELAETARAGRTSPERLSGGTISITNVGVFGVDAGTPILTPGEAAILAIGAVRRQPWEYRGEVALRQVVTLAVSFDHRVVDGEQGSRFIADIGRVLSDPGERARDDLTATPATGYACSAAFSSMPPPDRCSTSTAPLSELRRKSSPGTPESSTALTVCGRPSAVGAPPTTTTLVPAVT